MKPRDCQRTIDDLNSEMDGILYAISHDLRAPLRAIDGFSQAVLEDYAEALDHTGRDYLTRVRGGGKRVNEFIDGLLAISRQSRGEIIPESVDLSALVRDIAATTFAKRYPDHSPELAVEGGVVETMDRRLATVLLEKLLDNAWKFSMDMDGAAVTFGRTDQEGEGVCFVRDNGVGFDMQYARERLFGPFQRMHGEDEYPGLGIGLATARRIVSRHGGRIWADSAPGKGTTIYFTTGGD